MEQVIVGFDQDELGDWRAILACGHRQHVRHNPPFVNRPWVLTEDGRRRFLGARLECVACDEGEPVGDGMVSAAALADAYARFAAELDGFIRRRVANGTVAGGTAAGDLRRRSLAAWRDTASLYESAPLEAWLAARVLVALPTAPGETGPAAELAPAARALVDCLPGPPRQAILLHDYRGLSIPELAARLDISPEAAAARLAEARRLLGEALADCCAVTLEEMTNDE